MTSRTRLWTAATAAVLVVPALTVAATPGAAQAACTTPITIPTSGITPRADQTTVVTGNTGTVSDTADTGIAWAPRAFGADVVSADGNLSRQITVAYTRTLDVSNAPDPSDGGARVSSDSGATFTTAPSTVPAWKLSEVGQLLDGRLLGAQFIINGALDRTTVPGQVTMPLILSLSADKGRNWTSVNAQTVFTDAQIPSNQPNPNVNSIRGVRAAGRPIQMTDGTIVIPVYFAMALTATTNITFAAVLTAKPGFTAAGAVDTSARWQFTMRPVTSNPTLSFDETAVIERQDGALLAVTRRETAPTPTLSYRVSTNAGATWSASTALSFADQPGCAVSGVYPQLAMLPTGQLVLGSGRPDNWLAISTDASGTSWTQEQQTYWNAPTNGGQWWYGSSGYTALVPTGGTRLLQFADNCQAPNGTNGVNGCASNLNFEKGRAYKIVDKQVAVLPPGLGKIDLLGKLKHGTVTLSTDLTGVPPAGAVTPPTPYGSGPSAADATSTPYWSTAQGAVDGSTAFWSGALSSNTAGTGTYELKLDRSYHLTKIGLALLPGAAAKAHVDISADGTTWTPAPLTGAAGSGLIETSGDRALRYYGLDATARYLRIQTDASSCAAVGGPAQCSMINELELYSTVNSFENEFAIPRGLADLACTRMTSVWANGDPGHDSGNGIRLVDGTNATFCDGDSTLGKFSYPGPGVSLAAASTRTLQASVYPVSITNGLLFDINGVRSSDGATGSVYHLGIVNGGRWAAYTKAGGWVGLGGAEVPLSSWTTFQVVATTTGATLYTVDSAGQRTLIGTIPEVDGVGVRSITGFSAASGSTAGIGDQAVYDDISFE
ncbi:sialidase family protein [Actinoplanes cyaneus]|uniref:sialidase family protein n=1 Tax=Actinoplanes cyaneus TaxID=52696 RepID=UPI00194566A9|nr:sialidase family protein [Actinoplanes cyaneus]MCW2142921.1 F5/8 type C domain-containing protein [Actinoplanes cyaneus]